MEIVGSFVQGMAGVLFLAATLLSSLFGLMFGYHWLKWGGQKAAWAAIAIYALGCIVLLLLLASAARGV